MAEITPEIVKQALNNDDLFQYNALLTKLTTGRIFSRHEQTKYDEYQKKIKDFIAGGQETSPASDPANEIGIPEDLRVKRRYTMTPEALAQRKAAGNSPAKAEGMKGNRNGWRHGSYVTNFINKLKPCKSTCPQYPCSLVEGEGIEPGDDCLDKVEVVQFFRAVNDAIKNKKFDDFNELAALQISNTLKVVDMLIEDIISHGTVVKREKRSAQGDLVIEYVTHPSLLALPKLIADLGLNPAEFLITPRAISRVEDEDKAGKTIGDAMTAAAKALAKLGKK
jgi:hypothetical protein